MESRKSHLRLVEGGKEDDVKLVHTSPTLYNKVQPMPSIEGFGLQDMASLSRSVGLMFRELQTSAYKKCLIDPHLKLTNGEKTAIACLAGVPYSATWSEVTSEVDIQTELCEVSWDPIAGAFIVAIGVKA